MDTAREPIHLTITLLDEKLDEAISGDVSYDLRSLIGELPGLSILGGDPRFSLEISVPPSTAPTVRKKLAGVCSVSASVPLTPQNY